MHAKGGRREGITYGPFMHMSFLRTIVKIAGEELGYPNLTTYDLKRSAATNLLSLGKNLFWVQNQLGHSRFSMSLIYAQVTPGMSADANDVMTRAWNGSGKLQPSQPDQLAADG